MCRFLPAYFQKDLRRPEETEQCKNKTTGKKTKTRDRRMFVLCLWDTLTMPTEHGIWPPHCLTAKARRGDESWIRAAVRRGAGRLGLEGRESSPHAPPRVCDSTPPPQPAGACCRHVMVRMGYQPGVKGEKHAQGHLSRPQTQGNFPKIKVLDSGQHRLGRRELRPRPQSPGRGGAWGTGPALWSLVSGRSPGFGRAHALHLAWPVHCWRDLRSRVGSTE